MKHSYFLMLLGFGLFIIPMKAEGSSSSESLDNLFGMDDVIEQGDGSSFDLEGLAYNGIDPPTDPDAGVPVDGGLVTVIGGALYFGGRQLRKKKDTNDVV